MWLYVPSHSAPAGEASSEALTSPQAERLERSVGWSGKPSLSRTWCSRWKRAAWLRRLSGVTSDPSTLDAGVDAWISSLRDSPASPGASPASELGKMIRATCGPTAYGSLRTLHQVSCSWKTSSLNLFTEQRRTCDQWATAAREAASRRRRLALLTSGNGGSSWVTPTRHDGLSGPVDPNSRGSCLQRNAAEWPTPTVPNGGRGVPLGATQKGATIRDGGRKVQKMLHHTAEAWPTPTAQEGGDGHDPTGKLAHPMLAKKARECPTPTVKGDHNAKGASAQSGDGLSTAAKMFPSSHQVQEPSTTGDASSPSMTDSPRLSPRFVSWLMGWPPTAPDGSPCSETEWSRWRRGMRSALSRLLSGFDV